MFGVGPIRILLCQMLQDDLRHCVSTFESIDRGATVSASAGSMQTDYYPGRRRLYLFGLVDSSWLVYTVMTSVSTGLDVASNIGYRYLAVNMKHPCSVVEGAAFSSSKPGFQSRCHPCELLVAAGRASVYQIWYT